MDSQRFDSLTKSLATEVTRRRAVKVVLGGAAGGALGLLGRQQQNAAAGGDVAECCSHQDLSRSQKGFCRKCPCGWGCGDCPERCEA
jgi:hypothetical protein